MKKSIESKKAKQNAETVIKVTGFKTLDDYYYQYGGILNDRGEVDPRLTKCLLVLIDHHLKAYETTTEASWRGDDLPADFKERLRLAVIEDMMGATLKYYCRRGLWSDAFVTSVTSLLTHLPNILRVLSKYDLTKSIITIGTYDGGLLCSSLTSLNINGKDGITKNGMLEMILSGSVGQRESYNYQTRAQAGALYLPLSELIEAISKCADEGEEREEKLSKMAELSK